MKSNYGKVKHGLTVEQAVKNYEYQMFVDNIQNYASQFLAAVLYAAHLSGKSANEILGIYWDVKSVLEMDTSVGLTGGDLVEFIRKEYHIDCDDIKVHVESRAEYMAR